MALVRQPLSLSFNNGINTKTDPFQLPIGQFLELNNAIFNNDGLLQKRNGFAKLTSLPVSTSTYLTTFAEDLVSVGQSLYSYNPETDRWVSKGTLYPIDLETTPLIRSNTNQSQSDMAIASNGLLCVAYTDQDPASLGSSIYRYAVIDSATGQAVVNPTTIANASGSPKVFILGNFFVVVYSATITAVNRLQYIAISINDPTLVSAAVDITTAYAPVSTVSWDAIVANNTLYFAWNGNDGGGAVRMRLLTSTFTFSSPVVFSGKVATIMSVTADTSGSSPVIYASFYDSGSQNGYTLAVDQNTITVLAPTLIVAATALANITSTATGNVVSIFYSVTNAYSYDGAIPSNFIKTLTVTIAGVVSSATVLVRSVGLASKATLYNGASYFLGAYTSPYQPTYFLFNSSGNIIAKLAYSNGGGYLTKGLPNLTFLDDSAYVPYLFKDQVVSVNKTQGITNSSNIYSQLGINFAKFTFQISNILSSEIGGSLNLSGGFVSMYDGLQVVEQGFFLWPDSVEATWSATGGSIAAKPDGATNTNAYYYQVTYEWTDNSGNSHKSAPSIPIGVTTTGAGTAGSITVNVPTLRLTYKTTNPVQIVLYRWSVANQVYYRVTTITSPILNSTTTDSIAYVDTLADASIIGNTILYTTGGVLENIAPPAVSSMTLFDSRFFYINSEDRNLLGYSKQVIESTPVETSDLLTIYVSPTIGAQGSTGPMFCLAPMDEKLIITKESALYYINGRGPDNTGASNQYSEPTFISSNVGCTNQHSIVMIPRGLMFQSDKGIWLLGRDLSTNYIGAPVESYTQSSLVKSALAIPGTNQVRFTMDSGITLMYDYFYNRWATFSGIPGISSTLYNNLHTYLNEDGLVFQETLNQYLDNSSPVLMSFKTGWINLAGIQGLERFYEMLLLGTYLTPFKLNVQFAYNYNSSPQQSTIATPSTYQGTWGDLPLWGSGPTWGGINSVYQARLFPRIQKCESFQVIINELYDATYGTTPGAGLTLSNMNLIVGVKKGSRNSKASNSFG